MKRTTRNIVTGITGIVLLGAPDNPSINPAIRSNDYLATVNLSTRVSHYLASSRSPIRALIKDLENYKISPKIVAAESSTSSISTSTTSTSTTSTSTTTTTIYTPRELPTVLPHDIKPVSQAVALAGEVLLADPEAAPRPRVGDDYKDVFAEVVIDDGTADDCVGAINVQRIEDEIGNEAMQFEPSVATYPELIDPPVDDVEAEQQLHLSSDTDFGEDAVVAVPPEVIKDDLAMEVVADHLLQVVSNGCELFRKYMAPDVKRPVIATSTTIPQPASLGDTFTISGI